MPADSVSPIPTSSGPAIQMDPGDHGFTSSWGSRRSANAYRDEIGQLLVEGKWREAMAEEIMDVRRAARSGSGDPAKYNDALREMLEYMGWLKRK